MSYMSGMMMGMAFGKSIGSMLMGGAASGGLSARGAGASRFLAGSMGRGGIPAFGGGTASPFGRGAGRGASKNGGSEIGENLYKMFQGKPKTQNRNASAFSLARSIPGRRRYYAASLAGNDALAKALEDALAKLDFVDEVKANPMTGSLLFLYHGDEVKIDALAEELASRVFCAPTGMGRGARGDRPPCESATEGLAAFGQSVRGTFNALNRQCKALTGGWFDLPSLLSLVFTVQGVKKILETKQLPSGPQLLWWAFSILRGWRVA